MVFVSAVNGVSDVSGVSSSTDGRVALNSVLTLQNADSSTPIIVGVVIAAIVAILVVLILVVVAIIL